MKAFANIGARGFLTNGVEAQIPQNGFNIPNPLPLGSFNP